MVTYQELGKSQTEDRVKSRATGQLLQCIQEFRKIYSEMSAQQMAIFLIIADRPGISIAELAQRVGITNSGVSRNVAALGKVHRKGLPGADLVSTAEDLEDRRIKRCSLNVKGRRVHDSLVSIIAA